MSMGIIRTLPDKSCENCGGPLTLCDWTPDTVLECHRCSAMKRDFRLHLKQYPDAAARLLKSLNEIYDHGSPLDSSE